MDLGFPSCALRRHVPTVPPVPSVDSSHHQPHGDTDTEGPQIDEFEIAYFEDDSLPTYKPQIFQLTAEFMYEISKIIENETDYTKARNSLTKILETIMQTLYEN